MQLRGQAGRAIIKNNGCEILIASIGIDGALLITAEQAQHIKAPVVERKSTVGAGDSMVAGIVHSLSLN